MTTPTPAPSSDRSSDGASKRRLHSLAAAQGILIESAALVEGAPTSTRPSSARKADAASAIAPWVGARVTLCGLGSRPELNGRIGVVDRRKMAGGVERWEVQLVDRQKPGMRDGPPILIKPANMQVLATPPPASSRRGTALQISPCPLEAARDAIPVSVAPEPFPAATEVQDTAILQARRGWRRVPRPSKDERLQRLVQQVRSGSADAAGALADMGDDESRVAIARAGGIVPLKALLMAHEHAAGAEAARALRNLALNAENKVLIAQAGAIAPLVTLVQSGTDGQKEQAAAKLRNLTRVCPGSPRCL